MSDKHAQMREMARDLIRNSVIEDAIAQRIAQIVEFIHEDPSSRCKSGLRRWKSRSGR